MFYQPISNPKFLGFLFFILCSIPSNAQWVFSGSPETGTPIDFDAAGDTFYVSSLAGLFYSDDGVKSWHPVPLPTLMISPLEVHAENNHLFIVAAGSNLNRTSIYRSGDFGSSWDDISPRFTSVHYLISMIVQKDTVVVFFNDSLAISYDRGDSYVYHSSKYFDIFLHEETIMGIKNNDLYASPDHGITWELVYDFPDYTHLYEITSVDGWLWKTAYLFQVSRIDVSYSTDNGHTWTSSIDFDWDSIGVSSPFVGGANGVLSIASRSNSNIIYISFDDGMSWEIKSIPGNSYDPFFANDIILLRNFRGINISTDGGNTFQSANKGFTAARIYNIVDNGPKIWINANLLMFEKENDPFSWTQIQNIHGVVNTQDGHLLGLVDGLPKVSSDGGNSWSTISYWEFGQPYYPSISKFVSAGNIMFTISSTESWYSLDHGNSWHSTAEEFKLVDFNGLYIASTEFGEIFISDDGIQWQDISYDLPFSGSGEIDALHYHNGHIFASLDAVLYRLSVLSDTWELIPNPASIVLPNNLPPIITTMKSHNQTLIAGVSGYGVFLSDDNGVSWYSANDGLENFYIRTSTVIDDTLYISADGGIWRRALNELTTNVSSPINTISFSASPNPVRDYLIISLKEDDYKDQLTINLFDASGKMVKSQIAESPLTMLDMKNLPHGVYYLSAKHVSKSGVIKVIKLH